MTAHQQLRLQQQQYRSGHGRKRSSNDPLYGWKKHSGFKMGLLTDIVMGDCSKFAGAHQFRSTMHADYSASSLAQPVSAAPTAAAAALHPVAAGKPQVGGEGGPVATHDARSGPSPSTATSASRPVDEQPLAQRPRQPLAPVYRPIASVPGEELADAMEAREAQDLHRRLESFFPKGPAGKPLGFTSSRKSEMHIVFGDSKMGADERKHSITDVDFCAPPPGTKKPAIVKPGVIMSRRPDQELTTALLFHSKPATATSAAHIGLQTRQDLPIDDMHFRNFITTSQESYLPKDSIDGTKGYEFPTRAPNTGRASHIHLGDLEKQKSYDTVHETSFIRHGSECYRPHAGHEPQPSSILLGHHEQGPSVDRGAMYATTTADTYQGVQPTPPHLDQAARPHPPGGLKHTIVSQQGGASHIAIGEEETERRRTALSVTQRDFVLHQGTDRRAIRRGHGHGKGRDMVKALEPDETKRDAESFSTVSFRSVAHADTRVKPAAGVPSEFGTSASGGVDALCMNTSSVPTGDPRHYDLEFVGTTTGDTFKAHPWEGPPTHPILGANMTKSKVTFGEAGGGDLPDTSLPDRYTSTTHRTFGAYTNDVARQCRGVRIAPHQSVHPGDEDVDCQHELLGNSHYSTTHESHFGAPKNPMRRHAKRPHLAAKSMLFPLRSTLPHSYDTTTHDYFSMRDGLVGDQIAYKKYVQARESSIVFGDPKYVYFRPPLPGIPAGETGPPAMPHAAT
ncbi:hypothetical protein BC831DRAFT_511734 [Entophlyctis helioformis]|nr:hypothetical protein BC831DRAFT_511734 [Entophlyctis helioformis]